MALVSNAETYVEMDRQLKEAFKNWLGELQSKFPELLSGDYSNPYYTCVPKGWIESSVRILYVGEEGFGLWARGRDSVNPEEIEKIQNFCWSSLASYLGYDLDYFLYPGAEHFKYRNTAFWRRARKLSEYGIVGWTNMDLIHRRSDKSGECKLDDVERKKLHSLNCRILAEQIKIMCPTHVVYAGWYGTSIEHELQKLYTKLYPNGASDDYVWFKKVVKFSCDGINHIFAYHPAWRGKGKPLGYEDWVFEELEKTLD
jgi:hypothetical protein